jgi:glycolate oxidase FAD binding subunit
VVEVFAGTPIRDLQHALVEHAQCLPMVTWHEGYSPLHFFNGTVGGALSMGLGHALQAQCGGWRDWLLGATVVLADGAVARSGSRAVKNVAGFDVHKLFVGARGTLAVIAKATFRTSPLKSLPAASADDPGKGDCAMKVTSRVQEMLMRRAKEIFDPTDKLNPGEMGIF